jgi:hypothetical protein
MTRGLPRIEEIPATGRGMRHALDERVGMEPGVAARELP